MTAVTPVLAQVDDNAPPVLGVLRWNSGPVDRLLTKHLTHTFLLTNTTDHDLIVTHIEPSCECVTWRLLDSPTHDDTEVIAPGATARVEITAAVNDDDAGVVQKYAWLAGPRSNAPLIATLEVDVTLHPTVLFSPASLDFGTLTPKTGKSLFVTVTADRDHLPGGILPGLVSTLPGITIAPASPEITLIRDGIPARQRRYKVTVTPTRQSGRLSTAAHLRNAPGVVPTLSTWTLPCTGTIAAHAITGHSR